MHNRRLGLPRDESKIGKFLCALVNGVLATQVALPNRLIRDAGSDGRPALAKIAHALRECRVVHRDLPHVISVQGDIGHEAAAREEFGGASHRRETGIESAFAGPGMDL